MIRELHIVLAALGLLLCAGCTANTMNFPQITGYDQEGVRTGNFLAAQGTLTPY